MRRVGASAVFVLLGLGVVSLTLLLPVESKRLDAVALAAVWLGAGFKDAREAAMEANAEHRVVRRTIAPDVPSAP